MGRKKRKIINCYVYLKLTYIYHNSQITDYIKVRSHLRINYVDDVQILSKSRVVFYALFFLLSFFYSTQSSSLSHTLHYIVVIILLFIKDINEVKNNRNGKELRLMIIVLVVVVVVVILEIESERAYHTTLE